MTNDEIRLQFGELNATEMRLARAIVGWHEREQAKLIERIAVLQERNVDLENNRDKMEAEKAKLRAGMAEAFKVIDVLYMDAMDNHKESWPRARQWMEQWEEFKPSNFTCAEPPAS